MVIKFTNDYIDTDRLRDYFDKGIAHWNARYKAAKSLEAQAEATHFQDCFQNAKLTLVTENDKINKALVQDYFDQAIDHWRGRQLRATTIDEQKQAVNYQSGFQAARSTFIGSMKPLNA